MEDLKSQFEDELAKAQKDTVLSSEYKRKKLIMYVIRTTIAIVLFYLFWEHQWVKWMLWVYVPLNLFFLISIFVMPYFLKKKIEKTRQQVNDLNTDLEELEDSN